MSRNLFDTEEAVSAHRIDGDKAKIPREGTTVWTNPKILAFKNLLVKEKEDATSTHLKNLYQILIDLVCLPYEISDDDDESPIEVAIDFLSFEIPVNVLLREETVPIGRMAFFRLARRALYVHGGPKPSHVKSHPVHGLVGALYPDLDWNTAIEETKVFITKVQYLKEGVPFSDPREESEPYTAEPGQPQSNAVTHDHSPSLVADSIEDPIGIEALRAPTAALSYPVENLSSSLNIPQPRANSNFTDEQMANALELRRNRNANSDSPDGRGKSTRDVYQKQQSHHPATEAPEVGDEEFFWYPEMAEQSRQAGMRAIQAEFKPAQRFTNNKSDPDKLVLIQDVHLRFKRLLKANRFTESAAREILSCLYDGTAGRKFNNLRKKNPTARTDEIMEAMENTYVNSVTQRQASSEIKKLRLKSDCTSIRASVDNLVHRLNTFAINCPPSDRTDDAMINLLTHCTQSVE